MIYNFFLSPINIFIFFSEAIFIWWLIIVLNNKFFKNFHKSYNETQKIHDGFISKAGGLAFLFSLALYNFLDLGKENISFLDYAILGSLPIIFIGILEDFFNNIRPRVRLNAIILCAFILLQYPSINLPFVDLPFLSHFFISYPITYFTFLLIAMSVLTNGINLIDGVNGLMLATIIFIVLILLSIAFQLGDPDFINFYSLVLIIILPLLFFNFPFQKIFTGDMGAYFLGLIIGFSIILLFGKYPKHISWEIPLILFYPAYEVFFTMIRRFANRQKATKADTNHLHQKIFFFYKTKFTNEKLANNLVMPTLIPIIVCPYLYFYFLGFALTFKQAIFGIVFMIALYHSFYIIFTKLNFLDLAK